MTIDSPRTDAHDSRVEQKQQKTPQPNKFGGAPTRRVELSPGNWFGLKTEMDDLLEDLELAVYQTSDCDKTPGQQRDTSEGLKGNVFLPTGQHRDSSEAD